MVHRTRGEDIYFVAGFREMLGEPSAVKLGSPPDLITEARNHEAEPETQGSVSASR
jgi:hypothetical protein